VGHKSRGMEYCKLFEVKGYWPEKNACDGKTKVMLHEYAFSEELLSQYLAFVYPTLVVESITEISETDIAKREL